jgi:polyhydroxybutyrate depolymerase
MVADPGHGSVIYGGAHLSLRLLSGVLLVISIALTACAGSVALPTDNVSPIPSASASPSASQLSLTVNGQKRIYFLFRPATLPAQRLVPLVIAMHGYTQNAVELESLTHFDQLAEKGGFVVVYPQGVQDSWNAGNCCGEAQSEKRDDVAFVRQLIAQLVQEDNIDPKHVYATGLSNGGLMANRLACDLAAEIVAIASVSGSLGTPCHPTRPVSVLEMHGTEDPLLPMAGGSSPGLGTFPPTMSVMSQWARLDGCAPRSVVTQSGATKMTGWRSCRARTAVVLDTITGGGHEWFGSDGSLPGEPDATAVIWSFFSSVPARG